MIGQDPQLSEREATMIAQIEEKTDRINKIRDEIGSIHGVGCVYDYAFEQLAKAVIELYYDLDVQLPEVHILDANEFAAYLAEPGLRIMTTGRPEAGGQSSNF